MKCWGLGVGAVLLMAGCSGSETGDDSRGGGAAARGGAAATADGGGGSFGGGGNLGGAGGSSGAGTGGYFDPSYAAGCVPQDASVWFVIDGSGSMDQEFGGSDRWSTLRSVLMDGDGVIPRLQSAVDFGMVIYSGPTQFDLLAILNGTPTECPQLVTVPVARDNYAAIDAAYPAQQLGGSTPTHNAMEAARMAIAEEKNRPDVSARAHYIILATDGAPNDGCSGLSFNPTEPAVIEQTGLALQEGVQTFVISLAGDDTDLIQHLTEVANAGGTGTEPFVPDSKESLVETLRQIVGEAVGCDVLGPS